MKPRRISRARLRPPWLALVAVAGAILGTAWDRMHVAGHVLSYTPPGRYQQPWWVPLEFGLVFFAGAIGIVGLGDPVPDARSARRALGELAFFTAAYGISALLWRNVALLTAVLACLIIARLPALQRTGSANVIPALALVAGGPATEALLSAAGLFSYSRTEVFGIPIWLPLLYMLAVPFAVRAIEAALWFGGERVPMEEAA